MSSSPRAFLSPAAACLDTGPMAAVAAAEKRLGYTLPDGFEQMVKGWGTPRAELEKVLLPSAKALYRSGTMYE